MAGLADADPSTWEPTEEPWTFHRVLEPVSQPEPAGEPHGPRVEPTA